MVVKKGGNARLQAELGQGWHTRRAGVSLVYYYNNGFLFKIVNTPWILEIIFFIIYMITIVKEHMYGIYKR